ncbi:MAG: glucose-6-phosphate isomerase [Flavobacteriaceae bacterium]|nr:glucose-6-phosphate isomerase [Flavobacteriaceae bacterium]
MENSIYKNPTHTKSWALLQENYQKIKDVQIGQLFVDYSDRVSEFSVLWEDFLLDFSKNNITPETFNYLISFAEEMNLAKEINAMFSGEKINITEERAVLHTALRSLDNEVYFGGENIIPDVQLQKKKIKVLTDKVLSGEKKGATNKQFTDVVNIGIGGSDLGPKMVTTALEEYRTHLKVHFVSNIDADFNESVFKTLDPETTLLIVVSKSFTTKETLSNANRAKRWLVNVLGEEATTHHFLAVSANENAVVEFGIHPDNIFKMWDWVGGRFSLWSSVGLSISLALGYDHFEVLCKGAEKMDQHFRSTSFDKNLPVVLALLNIWYTNFYSLETRAIIPYKESLSQLVPYLQQSFMESNGKSVDKNGETIAYNTGNIIFGNTGVNSQHAFFQLIHQGTITVPVDFIGFCKVNCNDYDLNSQLISNMFAQSKALAWGDKKENLFKNFEGNKPSNTILIDALTPESLGKLIAMYEHQIFTEGVLLNINSFDQFGVELGKEISEDITKEMKDEFIGIKDKSTSSLILHYLKQNRIL